MKAIILSEAGGVENFSYQDINVPEPQPQEVGAVVRAISVNPVDVKLKYSTDGLNAICGQATSVILGWDIAGVVDAVGDEVTEFAIGDRVFGMVNFPGHGKAYAEHVAAPAAHLAKIPDRVSDVDAAAATLAALTARSITSGETSRNSGRASISQAKDCASGASSQRPARQTARIMRAVRSGSRSVQSCRSARTFSGAKAHMAELGRRR